MPKRKIHFAGWLCKCFRRQGREVAKTAKQSAREQAQKVFFLFFTSRIIKTPDLSYDDWSGEVFFSGVIKAESSAERAKKTRIYAKRKVKGKSFCAGQWVANYINMNDFCAEQEEGETPNHEMVEIVYSANLPRSRQVNLVDDKFSLGQTTRVVSSSINLDLGKSPGRCALKFRFQFKESTLSKQKIEESTATKMMRDDVTSRSRSHVCAWQPRIFTFSLRRSTSVGGIRHGKEIRCARTTALF